MAIVNGMPAEEWNERQRAWESRMAIRLPVEQFDMRKLVNHLLTQHWMHECVIELRKAKARDERDRWIIGYTNPERIEDGPSYLRYSKGPGTGTFWDTYGDDFHSPELALVELSKAYPPTRVGVVIATHGR